MRLDLLTLIVAGLALFTGCESESNTDPLVGWKMVIPVDYKPGEMSATIDPIPGYKAISDDVQDYVNKLPISKDPFGYGDRRYCYWIQDITLFEDGKGGHAIKIEIPV